MRVLRAALFAAVCIALAAMGHSFISGHDLPVAVLLPAFAATAGAAWLAGARRRGGFLIGTGLIAAQGALHLLFAGARPHGTAASSSPHTHHDGLAGSLPGDAMSADSTAFDTLTVGATAADSTATGLLGHSTAGMLAAHLLAAALCALWLARGEAAFFRLAAAVTALAFTPLRLLLAVTALPEPVRPPVRRTPAARRRRSVLLGHTLVRRGPPAFAAPRTTAPGAAV